MKTLIIVLILMLISGFYILDASALQTDQKSYISSKYDLAEITVIGEIDDYQKGKRVIIELISPDNFSEDYDIRVTDSGDFSLVIRAEPDWIDGIYTVKLNYDGYEIEKTTFEIKPLEDFRTEMITSLPPKQTQVTTLEPVKEPTTISSSTESSTKIPEWIRNIALWYGQRSVSEDEFINAVRFLIEQKIIVIDSPIISEPVKEQPKKFPDPSVNPQTYVDRYNNEQSYRDWFDRNYPNKTIYEVVGLPEPEPSVIVTTPTKKSDPNIFTNSEFEVVFSDPDQYIGKWAKLNGEITQKLTESDGIAYVFNTSSDSSFDISKRIWLITRNFNLDLKEGVCYVAEGNILGGNEAQLLFTGVSRDIPTVELEKYEEISCLDAKYPAIKSIKVDQTQTKGNMKVTVKTIDIAKEHTRVFVEVENLRNPDEFYFYGSESIIIQDKKQFRENFLFGVTYDDVEYSIPEGVIEDGYIILDPIEQKSFKLILKGSEWRNIGYGEYAEHKFEFNIDF